MHIYTAEGHPNKVTVTSSLSLASTCSCVLHLLGHTSPPFEPFRNDQLFVVLVIAINKGSGMGLV